MIDQGCTPKKPKTKPLQFKRGTADAFRKCNPILLCGEPGYEYDTKKLKVGDGRTPWNRLPYIGDFNKPKDGKSAYELWLEQGHSGSINDFLESLVGPSGKSAYEIWLSLGHEGTVVDFIDYIRGDSAYESWIQEGHTGTVEDFLDSLIGPSAYDVWISAGHQGTVDDYLDWLRSTTWGTF
jgi:hypothetical protein